jgi:hypothetical protein
MMSLPPSIILTACDATEVALNVARQGNYTNPHDRYQRKIDAIETYLANCVLPADF